MFLVLTTMFYIIAILGVGAKGIRVPIPGVLHVLFLGRKTTARYGVV